jgi:hypothetical protein
MMNVKKTGELHPENLNPEEILEIVHSKHVTAEQLNIFAAHARHLNAERAHDVDELDKLLKKIDARLKEISASSSADKGD